MAKSLLAGVPKAVAVPRGGGNKGTRSALNKVVNSLAKKPINRNLVPKRGKGGGGGGGSP